MFAALWLPFQSLEPSTKLLKYVFLALCEYKWSPTSFCGSALCNITLWIGPLQRCLLPEELPGSGRWRRARNPELNESRNFLKKECNFLVVGGERKCDALSGKMGCFLKAYGPDDESATM